ncbi:hypothetical protein [Rhodococcus sp. (in: high G+C Gram-positive bacteria)]|uniref:hypothetical protein n=1 Tax=Rhodococcus sp. TaxID=1831 RepID=UPI003B8A6A9F
MPKIDAQDLADALVEAFGRRPELLNAIAESVADKIASTITAETINQGSRITAGDVWDAPDESVRELLEWVRVNGSKIIHGDAEKWAKAVIAASGTARPQDVFDWAFSDACETSHWRENPVPIAAPTPTKSGTAKAGQYTQMLAEYRAARASDSAGAVAGIDPLIATVVDQIRLYGVADDPVPTLAWRRNALAIQRSCDAAEAAAVITWAMGNRPHWRSNILGMPADRTFKKMLADYRIAGAGFNLARDGGEHGPAIERLARGWACYLARLLRKDRMQVQPSSHRTVWELLTGNDGGTPVPEPELQQVVRWILDPDAGRARFYTHGDSFPSPPKIRKALLDMATDTPRGRGGAAAGVATTNSLAGDGAAATGATTVTVEGI